MGRAKKKGAKSEFDEIMDEIAPEIAGEDEKTPKEEFHQEATQATLETTKEAEEKELANQSLLIEQEAKQREAEAKAEESVEAAPVEPAASPSPDPVPSVEQLERVNQGLQNEIRKLREKSNAQRQAQQAQIQPAPQPQQVPVVDEGPDLEDLIVYKDGAAGIDRSKLREIISQETAPKQSDIDDAKNNEFRTSFMASATTPEAQQAHTQALARTEQGFEHLQLAMRVKAQEYGFPLETARYDQVVGFLNQSGVMSEVASLYPDVAPDFPAILAANAMGSMEMMSHAVQSYVTRNTAAPAAPNGGGGGGGDQTPQTPQVPASTQPLPVQRAPSLSGVGATPEDPGTNEQSRFNQLEKDFNDSPDDFPQADYQELIRLEAKFGLG